MTTPEPKLEYRIDREGDKFVAIASDQETVGVYDTEEQALADIAREKREDAIWERTKELMRNTVVTLMTEFSLDLETALFWVNSASGMTELAMDDDPNH